MNNLLTESDRVIKASAEGEFEKRANAELFIGGWKQLVEGVNAIVINIVNPLMVTADYVDKVSKGISPPTITAEYKGQYNIIKNNLNMLIESMKEVTAATEEVFAVDIDKVRGVLDFTTITKVPKLLILCAG